MAQDKNDKDKTTDPKDQKFVVPTDHEMSRRFFLKATGAAAAAAGLTGTVLGGTVGFTQNPTQPGAPYTDEPPPEVLKKRNEIRNAATGLGAAIGGVGAAGATVVLAAAVKGVADILDVKER